MHNVEKMVKHTLKFFVFLFSESCVSAKSAFQTEAKDLSEVLELRFKRVS